MYIQYSDPTHWPVLMHGTHILAEKKANILMLGTQNIKEESNRVQLSTHPNIRIKLLGYVSPGLLQKIQYLLFNLWVLTYVLIWRPDVVYASEKLVCPIAYIIKNSNYNTFNLVIKF